MARYVTITFIHTVGHEPSTIAYNEVFRVAGFKLWSQLGFSYKYKLTVYDSNLNNTGVAGALLRAMNDARHTYPNLKNITQLKVGTTKHDVDGGSSSEEGGEDD